MFDSSILKDLLLQIKQDAIQKVVVGGVIANQKNEFLILKRSEKEKFLPGLCELPSGGVDKGEDLVDALIREIKEETGLDVKSIDSYIGHFDYKSSSGKNTRQLNFLVGTNYGLVKLNPEEHSEHFWIDAANIEVFKKLGVSPLEPIQNAYLALQKINKSQIKI